VHSQTLRGCTKGREIEKKAKRTKRDREEDWQRDLDTIGQRATVRVPLSMRGAKK